MRINQCFMYLEGNRRWHKGEQPNAFSRPPPSWEPTSRPNTTSSQPNTLVTKLLIVSVCKSTKGHEVNLVCVETNQNDRCLTFQTIQEFLAWMIRLKNGDPNGNEARSDCSQLSGLWRLPGAESARKEHESPRKPWTRPKSWMRPNCSF